MIIGIDLGTTNSLVAIYGEDGPSLIPNSLGQLLTPSVVGLDDQERIITGQLAKERLLTHPQLTVANFKRYMGTNRQLSLGQRTFRPEELSSLLLRSLKADAEAYLGEPVTEAVITVPAYFNDTQRKATKIAGELAGLKVDRLLNEPTAAALAYGLHKQDEQRYLVFDLGGGTFDISIVEYFEGILEVHASSGDNFLGGNDFTTQIHDHFVGQLQQTLKLGEVLDPSLDERFSKLAEQAKVMLGSRPQVELNLVWQEQSYPLSISETEFEKICGDLLERLRQPVKKALRDSKITIGEIDQIVFVGGATRMPLIRRLATRLFERFPATDIDPDQVVAIGAAIQAGLQNKAQALDDVVLTDVCPYTLGIEIAEAMQHGYQTGFYLPIIERNNFIPISRVKNIVTIQDNQSELEVKIFQGESPMVANNIQLGVLKVKVPKARKGEEQVEVRFTYDVNGLLEVETHTVSTGHKQAITIEQNPGVLSKEEIQRKLKALESLKVHPRDQEKNRLLIHRAERLYEEMLGDQREQLSTLLAEFLAILEKQDERYIRDARVQFSEILDAFDSNDQYQ